MSMFYRIEARGVDGHGDKFVEVSFDTGYRGYWRCRCIEGDFVEIQTEPPFHSLKKDDQQEIKEVMPIIYYWTHGELPEDLSDFST